MSPFLQVFKLALKQHPLSLALVAEGLKPSSYCLVKVPKKLLEQIPDEYSYHQCPNFPGLGFYVFPWWQSMTEKNSKYVSFMIFNDHALDQIVPILNNHQGLFIFTSGAEVRDVNIGFYKQVRTKKNWDMTTKQEVTIISGLSFGFPEKSCLKFGLEVFMEQMVPNRSGYEIEDEPNLVFIGYPDTKLEAEETIKKWTNFKNDPKFNELMSKLKKLR